MDDAERQSVVGDPYRLVADQGRGMLAGLAPEDTSMVDELLAERRREAEGEERE